MRYDPWRKHLQQLVTLSGVKSDGQELNPLHLNHVQWFRASDYTTLLSSTRKSTPHLVVFCFFMSITRCILSTCRSMCEMKQKVYVRASAIRAHYTFIMFPRFKVTSFIFLTPQKPGNKIAFS
ncbi:hypothetical protein TNCT_391811 [Trichonephila clavata]|uniref:Uncharacterized protein n=1 Tax=Trichonephila clavata TaxID=2740835 RepID=A0A8X6LGC0_TRICU|nr:hypothetical protein TNCT_391811 [Trichonephila clavata]